MAILNSQVAPDRLFEMVRHDVVSIETEDSHGTGFVVFEGKYLVTCAHVVRGAVNVEFDDRSIGVERLLLFDEEDDIAIFSLSKSKLKGIPLKSGEMPRIGTKVFVVSNQLGILNDSITDGLLSGYRGNQTKLIQITAQVNPGSSGGPVFDNGGKVIGMVSWKLKSSDGLGFAIHRDEIRAAISQAIATERANIEDNRGNLRDNLIPKSEDTSKNVSSNTSALVTIGTLAQSLENTKIYAERNSSSEVLWNLNKLSNLVAVRRVNDWTGVLLQNGAIGWLPESKITYLPFEVQMPRSSEFANKIHYVPREFIFRDEK